ncbi:hypothetical protein PRZ48_004372 [Zasmidium cellare]|uniref:STB6-like N-terminal domain-containing protein n=1 Tax=Zasmidium cellare TaxID=395010 RepID=A0ABR0EPL2_ZASCE|nr:hypothetical protein PRZ48_004372 [Zasmidium cellare]
MATRASIDKGRSSVEKKRWRPPPLETTGSLSQIPTDHRGTPASPRPQTPTQFEEHSLNSPKAQPGHQRFVLTDPVAFRYLEEDPSTSVLDRRRELHGYECYVVEQWTTSRSHPTFLITTYTGDPSHVVVVSVLSVPVDESTWSLRLRVYFKALNQYHARRRDTPLGILMVTNLSGFPSSLTVIAVPDGDVTRHRHEFFVNEDLKRLGCSGRSGLSLAQPAIATIAKFHQLYRTSDKNEIYKSVIELVKLSQSALTLFDKLEIDYNDGLLCDVTEKAINDWWVEIGGDYYNVEPHDGVLGPTTVAGLLGLLMGARNRLNALNAPVPKDPFDVEAMKKGIGAFQKQQRINRTRRLDRRTLDRLHKATQKAADKERWAVPKAVKSTVAELSGKGGEMIIDAVGRRDRAGIAEIETVDIDRFVQLVFGDRAKWLWYGKPIKKHRLSDGHDPKEVSEPPAFNRTLVFKSDEHGGFAWTSGRKSTVDGVPATRREQDREYEEFNRPTPLEEGDESEEGLAKPSLLKRATNIGKGAVGLGHRSKPSVDDQSPTSPVERHEMKTRRPLLRRSHTSPTGSPSSPEDNQKGDGRGQMHTVAEQSSRLNVALGRKRANTAESRSMIDASDTQLASQESLQPPAVASLSREISGETSETRQEDENGDTDPSRTVTATASVAGSIYNGIDLNEVLPTGAETEAEASALLRRTLSYNHYVNIQLQAHSSAAFPRHLSFSLAEESVLHWTGPADEGDDPFYDTNLNAQLAAEELEAKEAKRLRSLITVLQSETTEWTTGQIRRLDQILEQCDYDQGTLESLHYPKLQAVREMQVHSEGVLREAKERLEEGAKEIETYAAKLDYEIGGLRSRVEDVQAGVEDYERGVRRVEERVVELEKEGEKKGWGCSVQ